jgi:hypothetical protein
MAKYIAHHMLLRLKEEEYRLIESAKSTRLDTYDRFTIEIPFANTYIKVRVMLNAMEPLCAPDIMLLPPISDLEIDYIQLIRDWNINDRNALLNICESVRQSYNIEQVHLFHEYKIRQWDYLYDKAMNIEGIKYSPELRLFNDATNGLMACISIPLPVNLTHETCNKPILLNVFTSAESERFSLEIIYPHWATHLHNHTIQHLARTPNPVWNITAFPDLVVQLVEYLKRTLINTGNPKDHRALFMQCLVDSCIGIPIEIDSLEYRNAVFHLEIREKASLDVIQIVVTLPDEFPDAQPSFKLRSMKQLKNGQLREKKYARLKWWNPNVEIDELAAIAKKKIFQEISEFINWIHSE